MNDEAIAAVRNNIAEMLSDVHTAMPGVVVSYDGPTRRAIVRPSLSKQLADGRVLAAPEIVSVPVQFPSGMGGKARMTWPLAAGDGVMLHFSERSLESWHDGGNAVPDDPRQFDLSDCVAVPGVDPLSATAPADPVNMVIGFFSASITMTPAGGMIFSASSYSFIGADGEGTPSTVTISGSSIILDGPVDAPAHPITSMGKSLPAHIHAEHDGPDTSPPL